MSPSVTDELAYEYWREWLESAELSEETLQPYIASLTGAIQRELHAGNLEAARRVERLYQFIRPYCRLEPLLARFEHSFMLMHLCYAGEHLVRGQLKDAADRLQLIWQLVQEQHARRDKLGLERRPHSEVLISHLIYAATIIFETHDHASYGLDPPEVQLERFMPLYKRIVAWIETHTFPEPDRAHRLLETVKLCEFDLLKMAYSVCRDRLAPFIEHFNQFFEDNLDCELRHYADLDLRQGSWCFWDFEVHKLFESGQLTYTDLVICRRARTRELHRHFNRSGLSQRLRVLQRYDARMLAALNSMAPAADLRPRASSAARS